ncbi:hypothetical protein [Staphylococcus schweitzeri]|uniref:hypothetical protein n=1 Tax=Staphylococcus schweitzeri TaxID=1654388 RepID=UPI0005017A96|nr:hypothetical protein [Staphylococcus schweitzeri]CDR25940.1 glucosyltransferase [Staphylococcus schweitzeri]
MKTIQLHKTTMILIAILLFYTFMGILLPLMHDDLQWFSNYNTDILKVGFASLNGRYIGNIFEIIAVHVSWLRWLSFGLISTGIIWMIMLITQCKDWASYYLLAFSLMLIMPSTIYADTYGWFAGFYNYATSTLISLYIIYYCINAIIYKRKQPVAITVLFYVLCFFGQLFMENVTLFNCLILILAFLYDFTANRMLNYKLLFSFMIATIGTIIMFSNPNYRKILFEGSEYQHVSNNQGIFSKFAEMISTSLPYGVIFSQIIILCMISAIIIYLLLRSERYLHLTLLKRRIIMIGFITLPVYYLLFYNQFLLNKNTDIGLVSFVNIIVCSYFLLSLFVGIYLCITDQKTQITLYILLISIFIAAMALVIVTPIEPGNFLVVYTLHAIILIILIKEFRKYKMISIKYIKGTAIALAMVYLSAFSYVHFEHEQRIQLLKQQIKDHPRQEVYTVESLPFEHYMHHPSPINKNYQEWFNNYEELPKMTKVKYIPFGSDES